MEKREKGEAEKKKGTEKEKRDELNYVAFSHSCCVGTTIFRYRYR